jgi:hypothetical protein
MATYTKAEVVRLVKEGNTGVQLEVRVRGPVEPDSKGSNLVDSPA